jgi:hypothetical protein
MPNWTQQDLHIVGPKSEIDRFIRTGFTRRGPRQFDDLLHFRRLCPLKRGEPKTTYTHDTGVILGHFRTRTQAMFSMITSWDYPAAFYARLAGHWPSLAFACSVNGEMSDFGGVLLVRNGIIENLVRDYDADYVRPTHKRRIARALLGWMAFLTEGRDFRLMPDAAWKHGSMPFDAHFDDDFWFYFRSREEMVAFKGRYKSARAMRRSGSDWNRVRITREWKDLRRC